MTKTTSKTQSLLRARMIEQMRVGNLSAPTQKHCLAELEALMRSVRDKALERHDLAKERFMANLARMIAAAGHGATGADSSIKRACEEPGQGGEP